MCGSLDYHTDKIEYLENQSRRSNIRIDGIREEEAETWDNTETKVKEILKEKLNLDEELDILIQLFPANFDERFQIRTITLKEAIHELHNIRSDR